MGTRSCRKCGESFYADETWKRVCFPCWKAGKNGEIRDRDRVATLESENRALRQDLANAQSGAMTRQLIRRMVQLCHPDKHDNSEASQEVTQWLLAARGKLNQS